MQIARLKGPVPPQRVVLDDGHCKYVDPVFPLSQRQHRGVPGRAEIRPAPLAKEPFVSEEDDLPARAQPPPGVLIIAEINVGLAHIERVLQETLIRFFRNNSIPGVLSLKEKPYPFRRSEAGAQAQPRKAQRRIQIIHKHGMETSFAAKPHLDAEVEPPRQIAAQEIALGRLILSEGGGRATQQRQKRGRRRSSTDAVAKFWPPSPHFSPRGEAKCVRGPSVRGARRLTNAGVLDGTLSTASKRNEGLAGLSCASVVRG